MNLAITLSFLFLLSSTGSIAAQISEEPQVRSKILWTMQTQSDCKGSPAAADIDQDGKLEIVFGTYFNDRHLYAISATTGKIKWKFESDRGPFDASVSIGDLDGDGQPEIIAGDSSTGNLICLNGAGTEKWRIKLPNSTDSPPAIADLDGDGHLDLAAGSMWLGDRQGHLSVFGLSDQQELWKTKIPGCVQSAPCLVDLNHDQTLDLIVTSWRGDRSVHAINGLNGSHLWKFKTAGNDKSMGMYHGPALLKNQSVVVATCDGDVYAIDSLGKQIWHKHLEREYLFAPLTVADVNGNDSDEVIVSGRSALYLLESKTGKVLWQCAVPAPINRGAAVADISGNGSPDIVFFSGTKVFVVSGKGKVLAKIETQKDPAKRLGARISSAPILADFDQNGRLDVFVVVGRGFYGKTSGQNWGRGIAIELGGQGNGWRTFRGNLKRTGRVH